MENIGNYGNLSKLFAANQQLNAYTNYQQTVKKGEKVDDALFESADVNGDGKITSADKSAAQKEINTLTNSKKTPDLYDVTGDGKIDTTDLINFSTEVDLDGDGEVSQEEINFLETQKLKLLSKVKDMSTSKKLDINGDGKIDLNDYKEFLALTEGRDLENSKDKTDIYLAKIKSTLESKTLNFSNSDGVDIKDLAYAQQYLEVAQAIVEGGTKYDYLSSSLLLRSDMNGDKKIDETDVEMLEFAVEQLKSKLGMEDADDIKTNYENAQAKVTELTNTVSTTKTAVSTTKKEASTAKSEYNKATNEQKSAQKKYDSATKKLEKYKAEQTRLNNLLQQELAAGKTETSSRIIQIRQKLVKYDAYVAQYEKEVTTTKAALESAKTKTNTAKAKYDEKQAAYTKAQNDYKQAQADLKQAKTDLSNAKKEYKSVQKYYSKSTELQNKYDSNMAKNMQKAIKGLSADELQAMLNKDN